MNPGTNVTLAVKRLFYVCSLAVVVVCVHVIVSAINTARTTGTLHVSSSDAKTILSVTQNSKQAKAIGTGNADVRLKPGVYQLAGSSGSKQATAVVKIYKQRVTDASLKLSSPAKIPSVYDISFAGTDALINNGITTAQVGVLEQDFFQYKPSARTVSISASSVEPGPHNPNTDTSFNVNFNVFIDGASYKATINYSDLYTLRLYLHNPQTSALMFDSYATPPSSAE